jgi:Na+-transporting methylmalonyl-CoA/oxaloacetate decarboxylase gamma subunit
MTFSEPLSFAKERGSEKVITWLTFGFGIVFMFLAILFSVMQG